MTRAETYSQRPPAKGRPVDRLIAGLATLGLLASIAVTVWFFIGFAETDPGFAPASSAFLLALLLGAFAIIPCAIILRLAWTAWRSGFRLSHGFWAVFLTLPWIGLAWVCVASDWMPLWLTIVPMMIAVPTLLWALASIILELIDKRGR